MKKYFLSALALLITFATVTGQDIPKRNVPSVILNNFQKSFPNAKDVEWEKKGDVYKVDFETGTFRNDHSAWYNAGGELIRHKQEISKKNLPRAVLAAIEKDYPGYRVNDVEKITEKNQVSYKMEVKSLTEDWDIIYDASGKILSKKAD
ncbi:MAG: PepSY-like domain-containing protein [Chitinophagaceae bacterium]|nr:PepSY-like domain-containing protein [Chitinophagaceae bacterium]